MRAERALSIADLAEAARRRLPPSIHGYVSGGSEDHASLDANRAAFRRWRFLTRPLADVSTRSQAVELFGTTYASPVGIAPMGVSGLCCFDGDVALARAAAQANVPSVLSAASTVPLERVMRAALRTDRLQRVLRDWESPSMHATALVLSRKRMLNKMRALLDFLADRLSVDQQHARDA